MRSPAFAMLINLGLLLAGTAEGQPVDARPGQPAGAGPALGAATTAPDPLTMLMDDVVLTTSAASWVKRDYEPFVTAVMAGRERLRGSMLLLDGYHETNRKLAVEDLRRLKNDYGANHVRLYFSATTGLTREEQARCIDHFKKPNWHEHCSEWWRVTGTILRKRWLPVFRELDLPIILMLGCGDEEKAKDPRSRLWTDLAEQDRFVRHRVEMARFFAGDDMIIGFDVLNEPIPPGSVSEANNKDGYRHWWTWSAERARKDVPGGDVVLARLYDRIINGIRSFSKDKLVVLEPGPFGLPWAFPGLLGVQDDPRVIFSCHHYTPHGMSHWGQKAWETQDAARLGPPQKAARYPDPALKWDKGMIASTFEAVEQFRAAREKQIGRPCVIWIGEFGSYRWIDKASQLRWYTDTMELMESHGYGWAYFVYDAGLSMWWNCMTQDGPEGEDIDMPGYLAARKKLDAGYFLRMRSHLRPSFEIVVKYMRRNQQPAK